MIYRNNPLLTLSDLADDEALNELELAYGEINYFTYVREDLRIAHERRLANMRLAAQFVSDYLNGRDAELKRRMKERL
jgi:hypothetical protein